MPATPGEDRGGAAPEGALRLTFSYDRKGIHLEEIQPLEGMPTPPTDPIEHGPEAGFWYELRDAGGRTLYRQVAHDPLRQEVEVYTEGAPIDRQAVEGYADTFTLLVPSLEGATTIVLFGSPLELARFGAAAAEIARFPLPTPRAVLDSQSKAE
jgi:hypothetical protein